MPETTDEKVARLTRQCRESSERVNKLVAQNDPNRPYRYDAKRREVLVPMQIDIMEHNGVVDEVERKKSMQKLFNCVFDEEIIKRLNLKAEALKAKIAKAEEKLKQLTSDYERGMLF